MSDTDEGWIVPVGSSEAHYRKEGRYMCRPKKRLHGLHQTKVLIPAKRCEKCIERFDADVSRAF